MRLPECFLVRSKVAPKRPLTSLSSGGSDGRSYEAYLAWVAAGAEPPPLSPVNASWHWLARDEDRAKFFFWEPIKYKNAGRAIKLFLVPSTRRHTHRLSQVCRV